ncbi:MAG: HlyC/CorC family transporter [Candidatus Marinimicrobia bacterium]|nr:HlyC/CorC family transporter [Candidatus Neomarinimicrobiota bacterium]
MIFYFILFTILLILSGIFSGSETALFQIKTHRKDIPEDILKLLENPRKLLISILTGNTIINVIIASLAAMITSKFAKDNGYSTSIILLLDIGVVTVIVLLFGEILPKLFANKNGLKFAQIFHFPLRMMSTLISPIVSILYAITNGLVKILPIKKEKIFDTEEELILLTELGEEEGTLQAEESEMIQSIFEFHEKNVHEIMTPRVDMIALSSKASLDEVMDVIKDKQYSKIPIYKKNIDDIKGVLFAKDILPYLTGSRPQINLSRISRQPYFVPENKNIDELLKDFRAKKTNIAIVVDEWGGTEGIITLEDIVEEVLGEIRDPYDNEESQVKKIDDDNFIAEGKISIYDLEEETELEFPETRDYDTLGGFIFTLHGNIPNNGQQFEYNSYLFTIKEMDGHRIEKVLIEKMLISVNEINK